MPTPIHCSFCGLSQHDVEVAKMITGPGVQVCSECVDIMYEIVHGPQNPPKVRSAKHVAGIIAMPRRAEGHKNRT